MRRHIIGASILMLFMLVGCIAPKPISRSSTMSFNTVLDVEMWASGDCVKVGDTVHLRATVKNRGTQSQVIDLKDKPVLDIVFGNPDTGHRWSEGRSLTPDLTRLELKPGESKSIEPDSSITSRDNLTLNPDARDTRTRVGYGLFGMGLSRARFIATLQFPQCN